MPRKTKNKRFIKKSKRKFNKKYKNKYNKKTKKKISKNRKMIKKGGGFYSRKPIIKDIKSPFPNLQPFSLSGSAKV